VRRTRGERTRCTGRRIAVDADCVEIAEPKVLLDRSGEPVGCVRLADLEERVVRKRLRLERCDGRRMVRDSPVCMRHAVPAVFPGLVRDPVGIDTLMAEEAELVGSEPPE